MQQPQGYGTEHSAGVIVFNPNCIHLFIVLMSTSTLCFTLRVRKTIRISLQPNKHVVCDELTEQDAYSQDECQQVPLQ